ncbi:chymotrypsin-1-like [Trichogramma pretiosum]|uniref:chymotrypsin-1-like n=1 Tax=Trichogramma pretiosum TaxID=7493 RepID=UPI0006C9D130|nr:chymotrypsin-1-like [Trichogramma pretiosum]
MNFLFILLLFGFFTAHQAARLRSLNGIRVNETTEFPYQASFQLNRTHFCGAVLISDRHALTAAHCVQPIVDEGKSDFALSIEVGEKILGSGQSYAVERISYHKDFVRNSDPIFMPNDIAVIRLAKRVELSKKVLPIDLPGPNDETPENATIITSGYGSAKRIQGFLSPMLRKTKSFALDSEECCKSRRHQICDLTINHICGRVNRTRGTCVGDSGGPAASGDRSVLIGIISGSGTWCGNGLPDIYTKVSHYIPYIRGELYREDKSIHPHVIIAPEKIELLEKVPRWYTRERILRYFALNLIQESIETEIINAPNSPINPDRMKKMFELGLKVQSFFDWMDKVIANKHKA